MDPLECGAAQRLRHSGNQLAVEEFQQHGMFRVDVENLLEQLADGDGHPELLLDFADEALLKGFPRLPLSTGKLPETAQMGIRAPLRDEQFSAVKNERGRNLHPRQGTQ